jgi:hypothetical protein
MNETVAPLRVLAVMETARLEVADTAMVYYSAHRDHGDDGECYDRCLHLHNRLMAACETYAAARELVIEP